MTPNQVRARLIEQGMSLAQFARAYGYEPRTVTQTLARWAGSEKLPYGRIAFSIIRDLSRQIGAEVIEGALGAEFANYAQDKPTTGPHSGEQGHDTQNS